MKRTRSLLFAIFAITAIVWGHARDWTRASHAEPEVAVGWQSKLMVAAAKRIVVAGHPLASETAHDVEVMRLGPFYVGCEHADEARRPAGIQAEIYLGKGGLVK